MFYYKEKCVSCLSHTNLPNKNIIMIQSQSYCFGIIITICFLFCLPPLQNTVASPTRSLCRRDQRDALLKLQKEFPIYSDASYHVTTTSWNKSIDCCFWEGVTCDAILGEVISLKLVSYIGNTSLKTSSGLFKLQHLRSLDLSDCNLQGEIPSLIGNLSHLTHLSLSRNQLVGEVPIMIGNLSHLTYLDLFNNKLVGEVPTSIGNLNQLETMNLGSNDLRGNIPTSFTNLTKLSDLRLDRNHFTGGDIVLANLTSLNYVVLFSNHFKSSLSATNLSGLHNLKHFDGSDNSFVGPFPSSLLMVSSLEYIGLSQNKFKGHIDFRNSSSFSKLKRLDVSHNDFNGLIPESLSKLVNLHDLDISHNNFGGHFPRVISKLVHLERLDLSHNNFVGQVPSSISKLVSLSSLDFSYNKLEGHVPHFIWRSSVSQLYVDLSHNSFASFGESVENIMDEASLNWLHLASNSLQGPIPQWICKILSLETLDLSNNNLTGSIPQCLKNFANLQELNLQNNSLSGVLPDFNGSVLRSLDVSRNNLVGNLPKSLINCNSLEFLNVKRNKINGTFPFWLGALESLFVLVLGSNALHGPVYDPSAYLGFPSLRIIDISNNNFVGSLPQDYFANWTEMSLVWAGYGDSDMDYIGYDNGFNSIDLVYKGTDTGFAKIYQGFKLIDFSGNRFSGHIPGSIGLLSELRLLNLSGNGFTGNIPPTLENITKLETLDLSRNNLSGEIPQGLGKLSFLSNINFSYNQLEGLVPQSTQFQSQNCSSFVGNPELHGFDESCAESYHVPSPTSQPVEEPLSEPEEAVLNWIAAAIAFAPGVFCGLVIGHIFTSYKYEWFIAC